MDGPVAPEQHWLLSGANQAVLDGLIQAGQLVRYTPGEIIFREGDPPLGLYLITAGSARVTASGAQGETLLAIVRANDVLGEMGVLDGEPRSGTATALGMCVAFFIPIEEFLDALETSPTIAMRLLALLSHRLRAANGRLGELPPFAVVETGAPA